MHIRPFAKSVYEDHNRSLLAQVPTRWSWKMIIFIFPFIDANLCLYGYHLPTTSTSIIFSYLHLLSKQFHFFISLRTFAMREIIASRSWHINSTNCRISCWPWNDRIVDYKRRSKTAHQNLITIRSCSHIYSQEYARLIKNFIPGKIQLKHTCFSIRQINHGKRMNRSWKRWSSRR